MKAIEAVSVLEDVKTLKVLAALELEGRVKLLGHLETLELIERSISAETLAHLKILETVELLGAAETVKTTETKIATEALVVTGFRFDFFLVVPL